MTAPSQPNARTLSRQELYELLWTTPIQQLAAAYGLSDAGLSAICDRHKIPWPPAGYWAKRDAGAAPPRPSLQPASDPSLERVVLSPDQSPKAAPEDSDPTDPAIVQALAQARALQVRQPQAHTALHATAAATLRGLERAAKSGAIPNTQGLLSPHWEGSVPCIEIHASPGSFDRVARVVDSLMRACDQMGMRVTTLKDRDHPGPFLEFLGEHFSFFLREKVKQRPHQPGPDERYSWRKHDYEPQGILELRLKRRAYGRERTWTDRSRAKLEDLVGEVIVAMVLTVDDARKTRAAEKQRELERHAAQRAAQEERRLRQEDLASVRNLLDQSERWHAAEAIRRYAAAVRAAFETRGTIESGSHAEQWLRWAGRTADRLDPMSGARDTTLTLDALYPPPEPRWGTYQAAEEFPRGRPTWLGGWPNSRNR